MKGVNESPQITPKKRKFDSNVFWIHGNPGSGKTVLASFIVEELQSIAQDDQTPLFYFFFRQAQPTENHRAAAYRSLLSQILNAFRHDEEILDIFAFAYETSPSGQIIATPAEMFELLQLCMIKLAGSTFLLDGLDECSDNDSLLTELLLLQVNILSNCKFVLLSRRNLLCLSKMVANDRQKEMERSLVSKDIARYLKHQLETLFEDDMLPKSAHIPSLAENMVQGADGMFLWAHLMISYLRSPVFTPSRRVRTIKDIVMPEGLEAMYERIICLIQCHNRLERDLASQVFIWLTHAKKRLDTPQLRSVIFEDAEDFDAQERQATDLIETVSFVCEGLVESRTVGAETYVDFIHLSVREYFTQIGGDAFSSTQCRNSLIPPKEIAHLYLAKKCFCELVQKSEIEAGLPRPFTAYAVEFVIFHLSETKGFLSTPSFSIKMEWQKNAEAVIQACHKFLGTPAAISNWIEKTYSHSMLMSDNIHSPLELDGLAAWVEWVDPNLIHFPSPEKAKRLVCDLKAFIADMQNVIYHWDTKLKSDPSLIWDEVSAFSQSQFLQSSTASSASSLISKQPENISASSRSLCTISETSPDCTRTAILSIWPSSAFEQSWGKLESGGSLSSMLHLCSGWTATYEIWIKSKRKNRYQISLEEKEISLLMRQSFREEFTDEWKTSFPLAISPSLVSFIVLRTMFTVEATWCKSTEIDMSFQEANHHYWDADLQPFESQDETIIGLPPFLRHLHHDWYSYRFTFSSDEKYVLLSQFVYHSKKKDLVVLRSLPSGKMQYVSRLNVSTRFGHEHRLLSVFHPRDDLLIFLRL
ncbi:hypothetical protein N7526_010250 [Penicillium atrosanguineum]|nr:hypothetical protein N7526_010250 [Penicillium atrosanguineum]